MKDKSLRKLHLIWLWYECEGSNAKIFDELNGRNKENKFSYDFSKHTIAENELYLMKFRKENDIRLSEWVSVYDNNGRNELMQTLISGKCPIYIKKKDVVIN